MTNNPELDAERYYSEGEEKLKRLPKCVECGEAIQDEAFIVDDDGQCWHEDCFRRAHIVYIDDFEQGGY